jgi:hypothetical protein
MKPASKILLGSLVLIGLQFGLSSCVSDGYVRSRDDVYYGPRRDPWFRDDPWVDGHRWYGERPAETSVGIYIYPPHYRR